MSESIQVEPQQFEIILKDGVLEPGASVAPTGDVTFLIENQSDLSHDIALVHLDRDTGYSQPYKAGDRGVIGLIDRVKPRGAQSANFTLKAGQYLVVSNTPDKNWLGRSLFELTVQPPEG